MIDRLIACTKLADVVTIPQHAIIVMLATSLDGRFKPSLTYLKKAINSFDESLKETEINIDQWKSKKSKILEDSHENATQFLNEKYF